jgi:hypothetical protein
MEALATAHVASLVVPSRFEGPPGAVNGGWIAGHLASLVALPRDEAVTVALRAPTPLDHRLAILHTGSTVVLAEGEEVLVTARAAEGVPAHPAPAFVDPVAAELAGFEFAGYDWHPFPGCYVCGHRRHDHEGLRLFPGPVDGPRGRVAALWTAPGEGPLPVEAVWGLLDCPTGWAHMSLGGVALLGTITARQLSDVVGGETYVVVAEAGRRERRKLPATGAVYTTRGQLVAASETIWIDVTGR